MYISGPLYHLVDLETLLLMKLGPPASRPTTPSPCARTCPRSPSSPWTPGTAPVPRWPRSWPMPPASARPGRRRKVGAVGFVGNATDATAHYFGRDRRHGHHAARPDRLCRIDRPRRRDVPRDLSRPGPDRAGRLFRPGSDRRSGGLPAPAGACRFRAGSACGSTRRADASSRGLIRRAHTRCSKSHVPVGDPRLPR